MLRSKKLRIPGCHSDLFFFYIPLFLFRSLFLSSFFTRLCQDCSMSIISWRENAAERRYVRFESCCVSRCCRTLQVYEYGSRRVLVALAYIFARSCNVCRTNFSEKGKTENDSSFRILVSDSAISAEPRRSRELSRNDRNSALSILRDLN